MTYEARASRVRAAHQVVKRNPSLSGGVDWVRRTWSRITEPRHIKVAYWWVYVGALIGGVWCATDPPRTLSGHIGEDLTFIWVSGIIAGAALNIWASWPLSRGHWFWERIGIMCLWMSFCIYGAIIVWLHLTSEGSRSMQAIAVFCSIMLFVVRWFLIRRYDREPLPRESRGVA